MRCCGGVQADWQVVVVCESYYLDVKNSETQEHDFCAINKGLKTLNAQKVIKVLGVEAAKLRRSVSEVTKRIIFEF